MDTRIFIEVGVVIFGVIGGWFTLKNQVITLEEKMKEQKDAGNLEHQNIWKVVTQIREENSEHLKDSSETRLELEKEMGRIRENNGKTDSKIDTILSVITDLSKR